MLTLRDLIWCTSAGVSRTAQRGLHVQSVMEYVQAEAEEVEVLVEESFAFLKYLPSKYSGFTTGCK
jgi:hypothetical protein